MTGRLPGIEAVVNVPFSSTERKSGSNLFALYRISTSNNNEIVWQGSSTLYHINEYMINDDAPEYYCNNCVASYVNRFQYDVAYASSMGS